MNRRNLLAATIAGAAAAALPLVARAGAVASPSNPKEVLSLIGTGKNGAVVRVAALVDGFDPTSTMIMSYVNGALEHHAHFGRWTKGIKAQSLIQQTHDHFDDLLLIVGDPAGWEVEKERRIKYWNEVLAAEGYIFPMTRKFECGSHIVTVIAKLDEIDETRGSIHQYFDDHLISDFHYSERKEHLAEKFEEMCDLVANLDPDRVIAFHGPDWVKAS